MADVTEERQEDPDGDGAGLAGVRAALRALCPDVGPACCSWVCSAVVGDVRRRRRSDLDQEFAPLEFPDLEFEGVLVRRFARRSLRVVADARAGRPVPAVWRLLVAAPPVAPTRLALAGVGTLLDYDLTLAAVGACTVLGRTPGGRERDAHGRVAAVLGRCVRELVRPAGEPAQTAAAHRLDSPATRDVAWRRVVHLWTLRGRPAEAEAARDALDRTVRDAAARLLAG